MRIFNEIPVNVQINILAGFIYYDFLSDFEGTFFIEKQAYDQGYIDEPFYTWADPEYQNLMLMILENLEPRFEEKGSYLFDGNEVREVIFIQKGKIDVGYMYNDKEKYVLRY